ncbi:ATP-grasp domain-containing protein [Streptomyces huasconensis]|uniref:ATP-grasp domain-containing protein n=1 Tax=Streptomyces huasconensis TaxID=1854574 RepID=UPI0033E017C6
MSGGTPRWFAFLESNTTGTGRQFCAVARARGLRPVLLARDAARYPYVAEDGVDTLIVDTADLGAVVDACARLADAEGLAGITSSSEYFVATAALAAAKLGLPGPDGEAIARCRSKDAQRAALHAAGVPVPAFHATGQVGDAVRAAEEMGGPVVLKPVSGSGSVGVKLCLTRDEVRRWAVELLSRLTDERGAPTAGRILVEEAVMGPEFSVETFNGRVVAVVAKHLSPEPFFVETGHDLPAPVTDDVAAALGDTAERALAALGLGWGAAHTELRLTTRGPVVIEVNPRLAGGMIPAALAAATGVDLIDRLIACAAGLDPAPAAPGPGHAAIRFVPAPGAGTVTAVDGLDDALRAPGVVYAATTAAVGRQVRITHSFQDRLGHVVAVGADAGQAAERAASAARLIRIDLDEPTRSAEGAGGR